MTKDPQLLAIGIVAFAIAGGFLVQLIRLLFFWEPRYKFGRYPLKIRVPMPRCSPPRKEDEPAELGICGPLLDGKGTETTTVFSSMRLMSVETT